MSYYCDFLVLFFLNYLATRNWTSSPELSEADLTFWKLNSPQLNISLRDEIQFILQSEWILFK